MDGAVARNAARRKPRTLSLSALHSICSEMIGGLMLSEDRSPLAGGVPPQRRELSLLGQIMHGEEFTHFDFSLHWKTQPDSHEMRCLIEVLLSAHLPVPNLKVRREAQLLNNGEQIGRFWVLW